MQAIKSLINLFFIKKKPIIVKNKDLLKHLIVNEMKAHGNRCDLNHLDVSSIADMSYLFCKSDYLDEDVSQFNGDISQWNMSNVNNMAFMFNQSKFNRDISQWDVSNVREMGYIFRQSEFNQDISQWNVSNVKSMNGMFMRSFFTGDISKWSPYLLESKIDMFSECSAPLPYWYQFDDVGQAIKSHQLQQKLENNLINRENKVAKIKL